MSGIDSAYKQLDRQADRHTQSEAQTHTNEPVTKQAQLSKQ